MHHRWPLLFQKLNSLPKVRKPTYIQLGDLTSMTRLYYEQDDYQTLKIAPIFRHDTIPTKAIFEQEYGIEYPSHSIRIDEGNKYIRSTMTHYKSHNGHVGVK